MNWVGALILVFASYMLGVLLADSEKEKLKTLDSLISLFSYMRRRINGERMPLYRIFAEYEDEFLVKCGFLKILRRHRNRLDVLWRESVALLDAEEEIRRELYIFGEGLGSLPLEAQIKRIDVCLSVLTDVREKTASELPARQKSRKTVCLLIGLMTAIILL